MVPTIAARPRGVSSLTWTAGENRGSFFANSFAQTPVQISPADHRRRLEENNFRKLSNIELRAGNRKNILFGYGSAFSR
jgi:hypothetical protein